MTSPLPFAFLLFLIAAGLVPAEKATAADPAPGSNSALVPPRAVGGNPYIARLVAGAREELSRPDPAATWPRLDGASAPGFFALRGSGDPRDARGVAARLDAYLWLFANPASPLRGEKALLERFVWWTSDVPSRPLPDHFTLLDRNTAGPRACYGRFNFAATLRDIPADEPGYSTLLGAQLVREDFSRGVILMGVYPRVQVGKDRDKPQSFAWFTSGLRSDLAMGRTWSAFAADYQLHAFGSSRKGREVAWRGRQLWLCLPDRLVGVVDVAPESANTPAARVEGLVRFGTGGTIHGPAQKLVPAGPGRYAFGEFVVIVHNTDHAGTVIESTPFRRPAAPFADLVLRDPAPVADARRFVVEIRPAWVADDAEIRVADQAGFASLRVGLGAKSFTLRRPAPAVPDGLAPVRVAVVSPDRADHAPPWPDFASMAAASDQTP